MTRCSLAWPEHGPGLSCTYGLQRETDSLATNKRTLCQAIGILLLSAVVGACLAAAETSLWNTFMWLHLKLWCTSGGPLHGGGALAPARQPSPGPRAPPVRHAAQPSQGDEEYTVVPGSDFSVARTALRSNTSQYYIDGRKSSQGQVTDLLKAKGVDLDNNRFLILQARAPGSARGGTMPRAAPLRSAPLLARLEPGNAVCCVGAAVQCLSAWLGCCLVTRWHPTRNADYGPGFH